MRPQPAAALPEDADNDINLTPMLDVVFIMLIFFIVTASFTREAGIDVNRPESSLEQRTESSGILVEIDADNFIWMNRRIIDPRALRANIERAHAENPDAMVIVQPALESENDLLVRVMDASRAAGVYNIAIAERPR